MRKISVILLPKDMDILQVLKQRLALSARNRKRPPFFEASSRFLRTRFSFASLEILNAAEAACGKKMLDVTDATDARPFVIAIRYHKSLYICLRLLLTASDSLNAHLLSLTRFTASRIPMWKGPSKLWFCSHSGPVNKRLLFHFWRSSSRCTS